MSIETRTLPVREEHHDNFSNGLKGAGRPLSFRSPARSRTNASAVFGRFVEIAPVSLNRAVPRRARDGRRRSYNIDGTISTHGRRVRSYVDILRKHISLPITYIDERLTTSEAILGFEAVGIEGDIDAESARLILESYLESQS